MARKDDYIVPLSEQKVSFQTMEEVMHNSMMPYAEHVILERALPRVEDGLKPVQRRVLYAMYTQNLFPDKPYKKSAYIVGETMAKYHPHGDSSIYETMVRMAQDFSLREPLVDGHGCFGSIDGDGAAAARYTEARLAPIALELLRDIEKDTVKWALNYDDSLKEPTVLPGRFPNLLVNGSYGIAVGLATNIPTHNLAEVIDGVIAQIDNPRITLPELLKHLKGPDFPTGGYIINGSDIENIYKTGRGRLLVRSKTHIENGPNGKKLIVITEVPFQVNKAKMLADIMKLSDEKKGILSSISDIRDESDMNTGMRAVIELRKDADVQKVLAYLYKYSDLQASFGVNMVAIAEGKPVQLGLLEINRYYIEHQREVERRRVRHDLDKARLDEEIYAGLLIAIQNIDEVIKIIKSSPNVRTARERLREAFSLSERQATAILEMRLQRLTALEVESIELKLKELRELIEYLEGLLNSKTKLMELIKKNLLDIKRKYKSPRRTVILSEAPVETHTAQDFKVVEDVIISIDAGGNVKRVSVKNYSRSNKDYDGVQENEIPIITFNSNTAEKLLAFSSAGYAYNLSVEDVPECKWKDKGALSAKVFSGIQPEEKIVYLFSYKELPEGNLYFYTKNGLIKCSAWSEYAVKKSRYSAISLKEGDVLLGAEPVREEGSVLFVSQKGMSLNIVKEDIPVTGRVSSGVKAMALDNGDSVIFASQCDGEGEIIVWTEKGYAKRSLSVDYELSVRNRKGLKTFDFKKNGANGTTLVAALAVKEPFDMLCVHSNGEVECINTESLFIEPRLSAGKPYVLGILGDSLAKVYKKL
ncbi:MAG: DNA topoisomerase 4 subunit A [Christensenellaceae bacterium]|jgi:DNA gyrase, A subunit|nr:DNA topoisomerase 4 subunit A [Christensenellaceae bacterium]PWL99037.1 MAG: DNA gyrase subunit A [Selenomonadales bacterium]